MKKYLLVIMLFSATAAAQKGDTLIKFKDAEQLRKEIDSSKKMMDTLFDNQIKRMQDQEMQRSMEQNNRNLDQFMAMQRENEAKAKKAMWIRLGLGVFFLGVLIFGLMRRRKKTSQQN